MIGVFVTFRYGDNFDEQAVRKIAETARARFEGMPGLRSKAFTINSGKREATNFYIWDSEDAPSARRRGHCGLARARMVQSRRPAWAVSPGRARGGPPWISIPTAPSPTGSAP
jgi:hypothetical protein